MKNPKENNMIALGVIGAIVVMTAALALSLNGPAVQGYLNFRGAAPVMYNMTPSRIPFKPLSGEATPEPNPVNDPITRAELAGLVGVHMKGLTLINKTNCFSDTVGNTYENAICALAGVGVVSGVKDAQGHLTGQFKPNNTVNRAEAAKIFVLAYAGNKVFPKAFNGTYYKDVKPADWFYMYVNKLADMKMVDILPSSNSWYFPGYLLSKARAQYMVNNATVQGLAE